MQEYCKSVLIESPYVFVINNNLDSSCHASALIRSSISQSNDASLITNNTIAALESKNTVRRERFNERESELMEMSIDEMGESILYTTPRNVVVFCKFICKSVLDACTKSSNAFNYNQMEAPCYKLISAMIFR